MKNLTDAFKSALVAIPLAVSVQATSVEAAQHGTSKTVDGTRSAVSAVHDFKGEVREYLNREKCYVLSKAPANAGAWLGAIGKFETINERLPENYGKKDAEALERAKDALEKERVKAKTPFSSIMDPERPKSNKERECLSGAGRTES